MTFTFGTLHLCFLSSSHQVKNDSLPYPIPYPDGVNPPTVPMMMIPVSAPSLLLSFSFCSLALSLSPSLHLYMYARESPYVM